LATRVDATALPSCKSAERKFHGRQEPQIAPEKHDVRCNQCANAVCRFCWPAAPARHSSATGYWTPACRTGIIKDKDVPVHKRIRAFNTKDTYPEQNLDNDLCQTVVARGTMVFVRGQIGQNLDTSESVAIGDAAGQTEQAMSNIKMLLDEAGSKLEHITKITVYIIDPRYREPVYRVIGKWLKGVFPVSTGIVVSALARPEWVVEVEAVAVIPDEA
jgi:enamine deaminase RidA (YjgF/YER057c/UK114 family)